MVPMIIIVRVGLGLAYQGASSTPSHQREYHDPSLSAPSSSRRNNGRLNFQNESPQENRDNVLPVQNVCSGSSSSRSKLDIGTGLDSRLAGNELFYTDRNSGERITETRKEEKTV